jgi:hypothetical protein
MEAEVLMTSQGTGIPSFFATLAQQHHQAYLYNVVFDVFHHHTHWNVALHCISVLCAQFRKNK